VQTNNPDWPLTSAFLDTNIFLLKKHEDQRCRVAVFFQELTVKRGCPHGMKTEVNQEWRLSLQRGFAGTLITVWESPVTAHYSPMLRNGKNKRHKYSVSRHLYWRNVLNENLTQFCVQNKKSKRILCPQLVWMF